VNGSTLRPTTSPVAVTHPTPAAVVRLRHGAVTSARALLLLLTMLGALTVTAPASVGATTTSCTGTIFNGQNYCPATISGVKNTSYGIGARVVLRGVSVTSKTTTTVTVEALESTPCPAGYFCGAALASRSLTVAWNGSSQPRVGSVIDLYGTTTNASLKPVGYVVNQTVCYIEYC
jgi:hypothetical protein